MGTSPSYRSLSSQSSVQLSTFNSSMEGYDTHTNPVQVNADYYNDNLEIEADQESESDQLNETVWKRDVSKYNIISFIKKVFSGPEQVQDHPPAPLRFFQKLEELPNKYSSRVSHKIRIIILVVYYVLWFLQIYLLLEPYFTVSPHIGSDKNNIIDSLGCESIVQGWKGKNAACGLNNTLCHIDTTEDYIFRCPAFCDRSWTYSMVAVGKERVRYRGYFIGGGRKKGDEHAVSYPYRADSYLCGSAVHSGLVSPFFGGCARVRFSETGELFFPSAEGMYNTGASIPFASFFPLSYVFKSLTNKSVIHNCTDPRLVVLALNIILGVPVVFFYSGFISYWTMSIVGFWNICLATDPPVYVDPKDPETLATLISLGLERFLPSMFILYVLWHVSVKVTLSDAPSDVGEPVSKLHRIILWYPLFWLGVLNNITFDRLPVDRLVWSDLKQQAGALLSVMSIIGTILCCAFVQAYKIWLAGKFKRYLVIYLLFIGLLFLISTLPGLTLRIHHYILAIVLIPGCATRGRSALAFQGILLGLFLSGASRWGLASIAETTSALLRDDPQGKVFPPEFTGFDNGTGILNYKVVNINELSPIDKERNILYDQIVLLINDVEQYRGNSSSQIDLNAILNSSSYIKNSIQRELISGPKDENGDIEIYLRLGRKIMGKNEYSDFSNAAILKFPSGKYINPKKGST